MPKQTHRYAVSGLPPVGHGTKAPSLDARSPLGRGRACGAADAPHIVFATGPEPPTTAHPGVSLVDIREQST
ncbi:hypothetical protein AB0D09_03955 [Streptomyces sp. NPDC049097]|uniref:hypothetical protein n=1 Tax=Streptomyces sp. NPDC049097 TaxID=3155497 RepID=UPI00342102FC